MFKIYTIFSIKTYRRIKFMQFTQMVLKTMRRNGSWHMHNNFNPAVKEQESTAIVLADIDNIIARHKDNETYKKYRAQQEKNNQAALNNAKNTEEHIPGYYRNLTSFMLSAFLSLLSEINAIMSEASNAVINHRIYKHKNDTVVEAAVLRADNARISRAISFTSVGLHLVSALALFHAIYVWVTMTRSVRQYEQEKEHYKNLKMLISYYEEVKTELELKEEVIAKFATFLNLTNGEDLKDTIAGVIDKENDLNVYKLLQNKLMRAKNSLSKDRVILFFLYSSMCLNYLDMNSEKFEGINISQFNASKNLLELLKTQSSEFQLSPEQNFDAYDFLFLQLIQMFKDNNIADAIGKLAALAKAWGVDLFTLDNQSIKTIARELHSADYLELSKKLKSILKYPDYQGAILAAHPSKKGKESAQLFSTSTLDTQRYQFFPTMRKVDIEQFTEILHEVIAKAELAEYLVDHRAKFNL